MDAAVVGSWSASQPLSQTSSYSPHGRRTLRHAADETLCQEAGTNAVCKPSDDAPPFAFDSAWRSPTTGLSYMRERWYHPRLRQFLSRDKLFMAGTYNPYAYTRFDPINQWDPDGLAPRPIRGRTPSRPPSG